VGPFDENVVRLTRVLRAPREEVFSAWTEPGLLERWVRRGRVGRGEADVDLCVGGRYRLSMRDDRSAMHGVAGVYTEIAPPDRLAFTWTWENDPSVMRGSEGSLVDVVLTEAADGTQLSLTHSGLGASWSRTCTRRAGMRSLPACLPPFLSGGEGPAPPEPGPGSAHGYPLQPWAARIAGSLKACAPPA
jgi:uncharacterized protein YndB with AHSA1/START domain